jgi:hypothetical protein
MIVAIIGRVLLQARHDMGVQVKNDHDRGMAQSLPYDLWVNSTRECDGRVRVA